MFGKWKRENEVLREELRDAKALIESQGKVIGEMDGTAQELLCQIEELRQERARTLRVVELLLKNVGELKGKEL